MKRIKYLSVLLLIVSLVSCDVLQQVDQMKNFAKCKFRLKSVKNIELAGIDIQQIQSVSDLGLIDLGIITAAFAGGRLPLDFTLNLEVQNPNNETAAMNRLDWILLIDDIEMVRGTNNDRVSVPANGGISILPLSMSFDLLKTLSGESGEAVMNFGFNLAGMGDRPTRITLKAKPTIYVGGQAISYPGYISIENNFTSGS